MILTGTEIIKQVSRGAITIVPFSESQINPNSYNYRLGPTIKEYIGNSPDTYSFREHQIPESGFTLYPGRMYLAATLESIGSGEFSMSLIGRSSMGRLGLFLQLSANLGHVTSGHRWTLELYCAKPIILYPNMVIGQVSFWANDGDKAWYSGKYGRINHPQESLDIKSRIKGN